MAQRVRFRDDGVVPESLSITICFQPETYCGNAGRYTPEPGRQRSPAHTGGSVVQSAQPRDFAALALVVGLFVVLLVVTLMVGPSAVR
jgi:hypothetical protein